MFDEKEYLDNGYVLSPFCSEYCYCEFESGEVHVLTNDFVKNEIQRLRKDSKLSSCDWYHAILIKFDKEYELDLDEIIDRLKLIDSCNEDNKENELNFFNSILKIKINDNTLFKNYRELNKKDVLNNLFNFNEKEIIFKFLIYNFNLGSEFKSLTLHDVINVLQELKRNPNLESLSPKALEFLAYVYVIVEEEKCDDNISKNVNEHIIGKLDDDSFIKNYYLGYSYYNGINGFDLDFYKSEKYLLIAFKMKNLSSIANTLGYIYYYGRTTGGIVDGNKAFQYFNYAFLKDRLEESCYKLADCYLHGYGTFKNELLPYKLVSSIASQSYYNFCDNIFNKFPDVAFRLGQYYEKGIGVTININIAYELYLNALATIKYRISHENYVGDYNVASGIFQSINRVKQLLKLNKRIIKNDGYLIKKIPNIYRLQHSKLRADGNRLFINVSKFNNSNLNIVVLPKIYYSDVLGKCTYVCEVSKEIDQSIIDSFNADDGELYLEIEDNELIFSNSSHEEIKRSRILNLSFIPDDIKDFSKKYKVAEVKFDNSTKTYTYLLSDDKYSIGDNVLIENNHRKLKAKIVNIYEMYLDELPLPLDKMKIIN